jgi:hypothetical protein
MLLEGTLLWQNFVRLAPAIEIVNNGIAPASSYDPHDVFVAIVDFLVFGVGGYQRKIPWRKLLSAAPVRATDNSAMATCSVYYGIWTCIR